MPDDSLRPTQGNSPEQRDDTAPLWWNALGRADLPDDHGRRPEPFIAIESLAGRPETLLPATHWTQWASAIGALLVTFLGALLMLRTGLPGSTWAFAALVALPLVVIAVLASIVVQRRKP